MCERECEKKYHLERHAQLDVHLADGHLEGFFNNHEWRVAQAYTTVRYIPRIKSLNNGMSAIISIMPSTIDYSYINLLQTH